MVEGFSALCKPVGGGTKGHRKTREATRGWTCEKRSAESRNFMTYLKIRLICFVFFRSLEKNCSTFEMGKLIGLVVSDNKYEFSMKVKQILQYSKNILIIIIYFIKILTYIRSFEYSYKIRSKIFQVISFKSSTAQSSHSSRNLLFIFYIKEHFELQQVTIILIV